MGEEVCNAPSLLDMALGVGLECVDHVRELDAIPDEEDGEVVADQVPIAFPVEEIMLYRQASAYMTKSALGCAQIEVSLAGSALQAIGQEIIHVQQQAC